MPTEEVKNQISSFLHVSKQGGTIGVLSAFVGAVFFFLQLSEEQIGRLKEVWWLISIPSILVLIAWMFSAYITEQKTRTKIEQGIHEALSALAANFERLFAHQLDDKMYLDKRFDSIEDRLKSIYIAMEKRGEYRPGKDTEKFTAS